MAGGEPSLAFVMIRASVTAFAGYRRVWRRDRPILMDIFDLISARRIDASLLGGVALFGIGWGIGAFCPGPTWSALADGAPRTLVFVPAMLSGPWIARRARRI
ncbi:DUF6691 family protein [Halodurantibacterium flavum]|uniref:DUF6691 family protein n=1 Tax=Halodurantibacterium flavum TaxID=1382802 RepID=A0ABW4SAI3_9RHOB